MKEITSLQKKLIESWIKKAETSNNINDLKESLTNVIDSLKYEKVNYFPRLKT